MGSIHIARGGELLGSFTDEQVLEGIRAGSFKAGDHVWMEGMEDWAGLDEMARHWGIELPPAAEMKEAAAAPSAPSPQPQAQPQVVKRAAPVAKPAPAPAAKPRTPAPAAQQREAVPAKKAAPAAAAESYPAEAMPMLAIAVGEEAGPAWEQRRTLGFFPALMGTIKGVLIHPGATFTVMKRTGGIGGPLSYCLILVWVSALVTAAGNFFLSRPMKAALIASIAKAGVLPRGAVSGLKQSMAGGAMELGVLLMVMLLAVLAMVISLFITSGIVHLVMKLLGGAKQPYETTFRVYCYSESTAILKLVPGLGWLISIPWKLCCQIIGLKNAHGTETWKALLAVLFPFLFCCCSIGAPLAFALVKPAHSAKPMVKQSAPAKPAAQKPVQKPAHPNKAPQKKPSPAPKAKH